MHPLSWKGKAFIACVLIAIAYLATGCATVEPFAEVGVGYQVDRQSNYYVQTERPWQCDSKYQAHLAIGAEVGDIPKSSIWSFLNNVKVGYYHQSWWACGWPVDNSKSELYQDDIRITKKWGGK
jgi:hypothetical protein